MWISGETVTVATPTHMTDADGFPFVEWATVEVADVLIHPSRTNDVGEVGAPAEDEARMTAHFPKGFAASLRGCTVTRADGSVWRVSGDPQPYAEVLTPGRWNRTVEVSRVQG